MMLTIYAILCRITIYKSDYRNQKSSRPAVHGFLHETADSAAKKFAGDCRSASVNDPALFPNIHKERYFKSYFRTLGEIFIKALAHHAYIPKIYHIEASIDKYHL